MQWKEANVSALYKKKGKRDDPCNYRPISLTSQICKIMERIIRDRLVGYLEDNSILKSSQHGFRRKRSCLTNLLKFLDTVTDYVDVGVPVDVVYLDFQKAFDKVPHKRLMFKVRSSGVLGKVADWIENWLTDRRQRIVINGVASSWLPVTSGVPQGSVLGPILFLIYINDLDDNILSNILKFADDTKIYARVGSAEEIMKLRQDLINLYKWSEEWLMLFNIEKCGVMHFGYHNTNAEYSLGNNALKNLYREKDLGVIVQSNLKVEGQCAKATNEANIILGLINRNFKSKSRKIILPLYKSLVRPHLDYCVQAWRPHLIKDITKLERVQRRATKSIEEVKGLPYHARLQRLKLTTLETRRLRGDLIEVFKIFSGLDNLNPEDFFAIINTNTRGHSLKLFKDNFQSDLGKYKFSNRVIDEWNRLSNDIIRSSSLNMFKTKLDHHLSQIRGFN